MTGFGKLLLGNQTGVAFAVPLLAAAGDTPEPPGQTLIALRLGTGRAPAQHVVEVAAGRRTRNRDRQPGAGKPAGAALQQCLC